MTLTAGSLFSGIGGMDLGLHRAGIEHAFFCEWEGERRRVLRRHWPEVPAHHDVTALRCSLSRARCLDSSDVARMLRELDLYLDPPPGKGPHLPDRLAEYLHPDPRGDHEDTRARTPEANALDGGRGGADGDGVRGRDGGAERVRAEAGRALDARDAGEPDAGEQGRERAAGGDGRVDLLCGGFPCQDLSVAGRRRGLAGSRSGLFFEFARVADDLVRPGGFVLIENVPGLLSSNDGRDFGVVLATLGELGFHDLAWRVLDSRHFGVPQRRRRVFILARRARGRLCAEVLLEPEGSEGHPAPRVAEGAGAAPPARGGAAAPGVAAPLTGGGHEPGVSAPGRRKEDEHNLVADTLRSNGGDGGRYDRHPLAVLGEDQETSPALTGGQGPQRQDDQAAGQLVAPLTGGETPHGPRGGPQRLDDHAVHGGQLVAGELPGEDERTVSEAIDDGDLAQGLTTRFGSTGVDLPDGEANWLVPVEARPVTPSGGSQRDGEGNLAHTLTSEGFDASEDGTGRGTPIAFGPTQGMDPQASEEVTPTVRRGSGNDGPAVAFTQNQREELRELEVASSLSGEGTHQTTYLAETRDKPEAFAKRHNAADSEEDDETWAESDYARTLDDRATPTEAAVDAARAMVRRLTPTECERLQGLPDGWSAPFGPSLAGAPSWYDVLPRSGGGRVYQPLTTQPYNKSDPGLDAGAPVTEEEVRAVRTAHHGAGGLGVSEDAHTLDGTGGEAVSFPTGNAQRGEPREGEVTAIGKGGGPAGTASHFVAHAPDDPETDAREVAAMAYDDRNQATDPDTHQTLRADGGQRSSDAVGTWAIRGIGSHGEATSEAAHDRGAGIERSETMHSLHSKSGDQAVGLVGAAVAAGAACPFDPAPDGPRYAALGDAVTAPVATWIGMRLVAAVERERANA